MTDKYYQTGNNTKCRYVYQNCNAIYKPSHSISTEWLSFMLSLYRWYFTVIQNCDQVLPFQQYSGPNKWCCKPNVVCNCIRGVCGKKPHNTECIESWWLLYYKCTVWPVTFNISNQNLIKKSWWELKVFNILAKNYNSLIVWWIASWTAKFLSSLATYITRPSNCVLHQIFLIL